MGMGNSHVLQVWVGTGTGMGHDSTTCNPCLPVTKGGDGLKSNTIANYCT